MSAVSRHPEVRAAMRAAQRALGERGAVMEGRDIGSAVFPDAPVGPAQADEGSAPAAGWRSAARETWPARSTSGIIATHA